MIKIAIIDDHELVLHGMDERLKLVKDFEIIGSFTEYQNLLLCLKYKKVDVLIMDLMLKDIHGFDLIAEIDKLNLKDMKIVLVSGFYEKLLHKRAIELGIKAFLPKECSYDELISTVYNVYNGNQIIPDAIFKEKRESLLGDIEIEILKMISEEYTNERIAKQLFISRRTVDTHVSNICMKLDVNGRVGAVREAIKLKIL